MYGYMLHPMYQQLNSKYNNNRIYKNKNFLPV